MKDKPGLMSNPNVYIILSVAVLALVLVFVVLPDYQSAGNLRRIAETNEKQAVAVAQDIAANNSLTGRITAAKEEIGDKLTPFFPELVQEKIQLYLNEIARLAGIERLSYSYSRQAQRNISSFLPGKSGEPGIPYDDIIAALAGEDAANDFDDYDSYSEEDAQELEHATLVRVLVAELGFEADYDALLEYLSLLDASSYKITVLRLSVDASRAGGRLGVNLTLAMFAIPKPELSDTDKEYLAWFKDAGIEYGGESPFGTQAAGASQAQPQPEAEVYDFYMIIKPQGSDSNAFSIGIPQHGYYTAGDGETKVSINISGEQGRLYYSCEINGVRFPAEGVAEFQPAASGVAVNIISSARASGADGNELSITATNESGVPFKIVIEDDDGANPRVKVVKTGAIDVIRK